MLRWQLHAEVAETAGTPCCYSGALLLPPAAQSCTLHHIPPLGDCHGRTFDPGTIPNMVGEWAPMHPPNACCSGRQANGSCGAISVCQGDSLRAADCQQVYGGSVQSYAVNAHDGSYAGQEAGYVCVCVGGGGGGAVRG